MPETAAPESKSTAFSGTDRATVDNKGRLLVSKNNRDCLGIGFTICPDEFGCLRAIPREQWLKRLAELEDFDHDGEAFKTVTRFVFGNAAQDLKFDDGGRVVISADLREFAHIGKEKEVVMIGSYDRLEIWDSEEYKKFKADPKNHNIGQRTEIREAYSEIKGK